MKLVAKRGSEDSDKIVRVERLSGHSDCTWLSVWWEPTEEDYLNRFGKLIRSYRGGEHVFPQLVSSFIPESSVVYAYFQTIMGERPGMIYDLTERRFNFEIPGLDGRGRKLEPDIEKKKHWWKGFFNAPERRDEEFYAEVDRDFMAVAFKTSASWQSVTWFFLVCQKPLSDWSEQLREIRRYRFMSKELLMRIGLFVSNRWEHGLELLSYNLNYEQLLEMAKEACSN